MGGSTWSMLIFMCPSLQVIWFSAGAGRGGGGDRRSNIGKYILSLTRQYLVPSHKSAFVYSRFRAPVIARTLFWRAGGGGEVGLTWGESTFSES